MYRRILVTVDGSAPSPHALQEALELARTLDAQVRLVHVVDINSLYLGEMATANVETVEEAWCEAGREILAKSKATALAAGVVVDAVLRETGGNRISDVITAEATAWSADLIVAGTHGRHGIGHFLLGSVAEGIVRGALVPVLLVRGPLPLPPE